MSIVKRIAFLFLALFVTPQAYGEEAVFECGMSAETTWTSPAVPTVGTFKGLAIYATWDSTTHPKKDTLPEWWDRIWNDTVQLSIPKYFYDNSFGQYQLQITPKGRDSQFCFVSDSQPLCFTGGSAFTRDILEQADDIINFAEFDADSDNVVDALFLVIVNVSTGGYCGGTLAFPEFETADSANNLPIKIQGGNPGHGVGQIVTSEATALYVCCHEWGHALGAWDKPYFGSFSIMNNVGGVWQHRPTPVDPEDRIRYGWITPIPVTAPLFGDTIPDYLTTGTVYQLTADAIPGNLDSLPQHFWVTNYKGGPISGPGLWQEFIPGSGLLIWHKSANAELEPPHGMWRWSYCNQLYRDSISGQDSLEVKVCSYPTNTARGTRSCIWPYLPSGLPAKINFDGMSNPTTNSWYRPSGPFSYQVGTSHVAVRNIQSTSLGPANADLLVNNWYGHITANTTWGPNKAYAITGDITVDSGYTLTIDSGTTVYLQNSEDNQKAGVDTAKIEIRVAKGGNLIINGKPNFQVKFLSSRPENSAGTDDWRGIVVRKEGYLSINNAVIRHAYAGIEDSSRESHTIQNVKIGRCKMYGILAHGTDNLTIRSCRIDSVSASPGGYGIYVEGLSATQGGALLKRDTVRNCYYGIYLSATETSVDSCVVLGTSVIGIHCTGQASDGSPDALTISNTAITGYFNYEHLRNDYQGQLLLNNCNLASAPSPSRTSVGIRNIGFENYLRVRKSQITEWQSMGVLVAHNSGEFTDLGDSTAQDSGNYIYTGSTYSSRKYVWDQSYTCCDTPVIKAEYNCWGEVNPPASRFSNNIDRSPVDYSCMVDPKVAVEEKKEEGNLPRRTTLYQNYPNPFNPTTLIQFELAKPERVNLAIYNILGQRVRTMLAGEEFAAGPYTFLWDGKDERGSSVSSGMYTYRLLTPSFSQTKKMMLVK